MRLKEWQLAFEAFLLDATPADHALADSLIGGPTLDVGTGLAIYHNAYAARLLEVLTHDFPAIHYWMGDEEFDLLATFDATPPAQSTQQATAGDAPRPLRYRLTVEGLKQIGLEAEFTLYVQDEKRLPEHVFRNPQAIVRERMLPRTGRSYHLPSGGALYFDTGVIEVATPIIEL